MKNSVIPIFVPHMGCPNNCVFCNQKKISGHFGIPNAKAEIEAALARAPESCPQIAFYGGSFTAIDAQLQEQLLAQALPYVEKGKADSIRVSTRPDCIDEAVLQRLKKFKVKTIELGVQSMDEEVLRLSKRGHHAQDTVNAARLIKQEGFELILQMMTGLPGDRGEQSIYTARQIIEMEPVAVRIYPTAVLPDTQLYCMWERGEYSAQTLEQAVELCAVLVPMFEENNIPVIRLGLNPSPELDQSVAAGAYHPALGDMVKGRVLRNQVQQLLVNAPDTAGKTLTILVRANQVSTMVGHKRCNVEYFIQNYGFKSVKVKPGENEKPQIKVE